MLTYVAIAFYKPVGKQKYQIHRNLIQVHINFCFRCFVFRVPLLPTFTQNEPDW